MRLKITRIALLLLLPVLLDAEAVKDVLSRMDAAAATLREVKAKITKVSLTAIINDETTDHGTMWMSRSGPKAKTIRMRVDFEPPDERSVAFHGQKAEIYYPKIKTVQEYDLGKHRSLVDQFLVLGFGTPGKQLAKDYSMRLMGDEEVAGLKTSHLELTPKSKKARERLVKVDLWIADNGGYPVQQKFYWPSDDTTTITYAGIEVNPGLSDRDLALDLPPGAKREYPQR